MKRLLAASVLAAVALPAAHASRQAAVPGLVYTAGYGNSIVTGYDPVTLVRSGPRVRLGGNASSWSWSPRRRFLAIASYPQRLTIVEVASMRAAARVRIADGGGVVRGVTWVGAGSVLALVDSPRGAIVSEVDTAARRVVERALFPGRSALELERTREGLVVLLGPRSGIGPAGVAVVRPDGPARVATVAQVRAGLAVRANGAHEQQRPGLAVDPVAGKAYVVGGDRVVTVDLRTLAVSDPGPVRSLAKRSLGATRFAEWLGNGRVAVSGENWDSTARNLPAGLRIVDVRTRTAHVVDRSARSFTLAGGRLLVERRLGSRALAVTAYALEGRALYRIELEWATWMKKQGSLGYACRYALLRSVVDLRSGRTVRTGFPAGTRCPTLLTGDSRG